MAGRKKGTPKTGGRVKGSLNKGNQSIMDKLASINCDPIEGMAKIAKKAMEEGELSLALMAYKELAQYVAPKRKSIEVSGELEIDVVQDILVSFKDIPSLD